MQVGRFNLLRTRISSQFTIIAHDIETVINAETKHRVPKNPEKARVCGDSLVG